MAVSTPLGLADFWQKIRFSGRPEFQLMQYKRQSQDGAGNMISSRLGQPKWMCEVATANGRHDADMDVQAMIKLLLGRDTAFLAYDIRRPCPRLDPRGAGLAGASVALRTMGQDNRSLSLKGLPGHYTLSIGDRVSVGDGAGKRALFEAMETIAANNAGVTAEFEVQPFLPAWLAPDMPVDLSKPQAKFKIVAGSYKPQSAGGNRTDGIGFSMVSVV